MQLLFDFFPVIIFFAVYKIAGVYAATGAIIAAMAVQVAVQWIAKRTVSRMLLISTGLVVLLGSVTLVLRNPIFIQWKPTIVNWLFAAAFLGSQYIGQQNLTRRMMGHAVQLPDSVWRQLNMIWVANFLVLGAANLFVVYNFSENTWVNFKLFGMLGLTLLTAIGQAIWIANHGAAVPEGNKEPQKES
jgi:intracellular septation protein